MPAGRALDAAEHLLVKCRPLAAQWGTERFGLADPSVLQAIEVGLRGVVLLAWLSLLQQVARGGCLEDPSAFR